MTAALPPIHEDPSVVEGQRLRSTFVPQAQKIRENRSLTDIQVAEQVVALWTSTNEKLGSLFQDLQGRRHARLATLETVVPLGPAVPPDASAADTAVINQAFRSALAEARALSPAPPDGNGILTLSPSVSLDSMLADAEKFDDDNLRRAVLTAAYEGGHMKVVRTWTDLMGATKQLDEFYELQRAVAGQGQAGSWNFVAFSAIKAPPEVANLTRLQAAQESETTARVQQSATENRYRRF